MKSKLFKFFNILFIILLFVYVYYDDDIRNYINAKLNSSVGSVVNYNVDNLNIYFVDVGQADCILIKYLDSNVLIDAGNNEDGVKIVGYFKSLGVDKFKYVFATHAHEDHIGGMDDIINNFDIEHFYMPDVITTSKTYEDVLDSLYSKKIKYDTPKVDSKLCFEDICLDVLSVGNDKENLNDTSIVLRLVYKKTSYLFMGDASVSVEKKILDKDISSTVLKVGHHGSQYSSSAQFLNKVRPQYAIIQVGKNNSYNHPKQVVLNKFKRMNTTVYRNDKDGTIILSSDGENISFNFDKTDTNGG